MVGTGTAVEKQPILDHYIPAHPVDRSDIYLVVIIIIIIIIYIIAIIIISTMMFIVMATHVYLPSAFGKGFCHGTVSAAAQGMRQYGQSPVFFPL